MAKSEIRKDFLLDKYVIIAPERNKRPSDLDKDGPGTKKMVCPFCPENIDKKNIKDIVGSKDNWTTLCLKNIFSALDSGNQKAYGYQEVIVEHHDHNLALADMSSGHIAELLKFYARRTKELSQDKKIDYILCFKNQGAKAGASLNHSHSQIFASQLLPPEIEEESARVRDYRERKRSCYYCDLIKKEAKSQRIISSGEHFIAFAPYASQYQYEAWILAKRHLDNITKLNEDEFSSLADLLKRLLKKIKILNLAYNFFLHQIISDRDQHFCLKIQPRSSVWAGIELGSGLAINLMAPEMAAEFYRK